MRSLTSSVMPLEHNWNLFGTRMESRFQKMDHRSPSLKLPLMTVESISVSGQMNSDPPKFLIVLAGPWWYVIEVGIHFVHKHPLAYVYYVCSAIATACSGEDSATSITQEHF